MNIEEIAKKYNIRLLIQFGSSVKGQMHQESDFDLAYLSQSDLTLTEEGQLILALAVALRLPVDKIDLSRIKHASPLLLKEIFASGKLLYQKDELLFDQYNIYAHRLFEEAKPIFENTARVVNQRAQKYQQELAQ